MESTQIGDFVIKLEGDKLVIQHVGAPNKVIAVIPSSSNKVIIDTKEV